MNYKWKYKTPEGFSDIWLRSDGQVLTGLWFEGSRDERKHGMTCEEQELPIFEETARWLDVFFSGRQPDFTPAYRIDGLTDFRRDVMECMLEIPWGETVTYGEIAARLAEQRCIARMSAQAVGGAVGWNPICLIIPCHRVVGADRTLTGYGGGLENKKALLELEKSTPFR
ncbi:MAG: methylated-DNA--[Firmicutes bacterium]|nr:methylated-DNA--[protein]-cysteine S-methyltransferase [Bacillota bacterium]